MVSEGGQKDRGEMALAANIFNNYLSKIEDVTLCLLCSDNNSLGADSLLYNKERSKSLGSTQRNAPSKNYLKPTVNRNTKDLHSDTEGPLTYLMKPGMFWKLNCSI